MRRRNTIRIATLAVVAAGAFLVLNPAASGGKSSDKPCKESMDQCCKKAPAKSGKVALENLSQHFFSSI